MTKRVRCAIYTRKSTEEGLNQDFNSLDAQREACEAYVHSQKGMGWCVLKNHYDDGGLSGGTLKRPALQALLGDIERGKVDLVVVYKVDRLTRSLMDFAKIIETLDEEGVSFVSVTQQFNTANSMGRLTLNVLLSFAQFEREVTAERIRDKIAASKKKGMWMGGLSPLGYDALDKKLVMNKAEAEIVNALFDLYLQCRSIRKLTELADREGHRTKLRTYGNRSTGGKSFSRGHLSQLLRNPVYVGDVMHKGQVYPGQHDAIVQRETWDVVQAILNQQTQTRRSSTNAKRAHLLTGLLYDETGDRLTPTHAGRKGKRYRYYISKRLVNDPGASAGWRIPAGELESTVITEVGRLLKDPKHFLEVLDLGSGSPGDLLNHLQAAEIAAARLKEGDREQIRETVRGLVSRVDLSPDNLRIEISRIELARMVHAPTLEDSPPFVVHLPITFQRRGVESRIIIPGQRQAPGTDQKLVNLIAKAHQWFSWITKGKAASVREIARKEGMDEGDVSRFLPLAFLAPDIIEAILTGRQPFELTAEKLKRLRKLPYYWKEQRKILAYSD